MEDCQSILMNTFTTSRQRHKARLILSGIFSFSVKRGWCDENPILRVDTPFLKEQEIRPDAEGSDTLLKTCMDEFNGTCVAGAALMILRASGRRKWSACSGKTSPSGRLRDPEFQTYQDGRRAPRHHSARAGQMAQILPRQDKAGPAHAHLPEGMDDQMAQNPEKSGMGQQKRSWVPDCLRHTYASYHAKHFKDYNLLQMEMGHRSSSLLRTRYLNMKGISVQTANRFWALTPAKVIEEMEAPAEMPQ